METEAKTHLAAFQKLAERAAEGSLAAARPAPKLVALAAHRDQLVELAAQGVSARAISRVLAEGGFQISPAWISAFLRKCPKPKRKTKMRPTPHAASSSPPQPKTAAKQAVQTSASTVAAEDPDFTALLDQISNPGHQAVGKRVIETLQTKTSV